MINLIYIPQRSDLKVEYATEGDALIARVGEKEEVFDFTGLGEGVAEKIIAEILPFNPIISAEKIGDTVNTTVIQFYGEDEKHLYEVVKNG